MGLFLRKSFRLGPVRINLSKSGLGLSTGIKGARVGIGPSGSYVHGGRHGLYYRKQLTSGQSHSQSSVGQDKGCATLLLLVVIVGIFIGLLRWFIANPMYFIIGT